MNAGEFVADPTTESLKTSTSVALNFKDKEAAILGTGYEEIQLIRKGQSVDGDIAERKYWKYKKNLLNNWDKLLIPMDSAVNRKLSI